MRFPGFLPNVPVRTAWFRGILLLGLGLMLVASAPVWTNARAFPLLPIFPGFPRWFQTLYRPSLGFPIKKELGYF